MVKDDVHAGGRAAVDYYFIQDDGGMLCVLPMSETQEHILKLSCSKSTIVYEPYFLIACKVRISAGSAGKPY